MMITCCIYCSIVHYCTILCGAAGIEQASMCTSLQHLSSLRRRGFSSTQQRRVCIRTIQQPSPPSGPGIYTYSSIQHVYCNHYDAGAQYDQYTAEEVGVLQHILEESGAAWISYTERTLFLRAASQRPYIYRTTLR